MTERAPFTTRDTCRLCDLGDLWRAIPLAPLPVASPNVGAGGRGAETAPADVWQCRACGHLQLATLVEAAFQYRNFRYVTGISLGLREHFGALVAGLGARGDVGPGRFVVDIGSNDGSLLRFAKERGARVLGVDPAEVIAREATASGIPTLAEFFGPGLAEEIVRDHGHANVIISNNTIANIDDLGPLFDGMAHLLAGHGLLVIETQYAADVLEKTLLDVIYHEHVSYFAVRPMERFLAARGFALIGAERIAPKGGSIRFIAQKRGGPRRRAAGLDALIAGEEALGLYEEAVFDAFNARIATLGADIRRRLDATRARHGRALAYGASVGCAALIHYLDLGGRIDAIYDDHPLTELLRTPERDIPVLPGARLAGEAPSEVAVLAWRYGAAIARGQADFIRAGGRFYRALPDLAFVDETEGVTA